MSLVFDANRARAAGLVQLPRSIQGASCENCQYFRYEPQARDRSIGYCSHFRMMMNVMADWHCDMWKRPDAPLASPPGRQAGLGQRFARSLVQRYSRGAGGGPRAAAGSRLSSTDLACQRADDDLRVIDLALPDRPSRRFAKAGDADDCGHDPDGLFGDENECAVAGGASGKGYSFHSPNIEEDTKFSRARKMLRSSNQRVARDQSEEIDRSLGLESRSYDAVGDWSDGAENSVVSRHDGVKSFDQVREAAALKGLKWNQKAVIPFIVDENGPDLIYEVDISDTDVRSVRRKLEEAGIAFRSIIPLKGGIKVIVFDQGDQLSDNLSNFEDSYEEGQVSGQSYRGLGEFLGADTRTGARRVYIDAIHQARAARQEEAKIHPGRYRRGSGPGLDHWRGEKTRVVSRRFARAGDADDCGHERHGGLFTPKNTCAAGGSGRQVGTSPPPRHALSPLGNESDRRLIDAAKRLIEAKADAQAAAQEPRKRSLPSPSVMSPEPFEPDEPIRRRIANLPGGREMLAEIIDKIPPYHDRMKEDQADLVEIDKQLMDMLYRDRNDPKLVQSLATRDRLMDSIDSARDKMLEVISSLTGHNKDIKFKSVDGLGDWDGEAGRRRHQALSWLQSTFAGRGDAKVKWNTAEDVPRAGAVTQTLPYEIDVDSNFSGTEVYVHEMGHVIERSVSGVHEAAREFLEYRTMHTPDRKMKEFYPTRNYGDNEIGNEDDFGKLHKRGAYIGKKYPKEDAMTEIVSMGLQILYDDPVHFAQADPEYCAFMLGILRGDLRSPAREHKFS